MALPPDHKVTAAVTWCSLSLPRMHPSSMAAVQSYSGFEVTAQVSRGVVANSSQFPANSAASALRRVVELCHVFGAGHQSSPNWCCCRCSAFGFVHATGCRKNSFG